MTKMFKHIAVAIAAAAIAFAASAQPAHAGPRLKPSTVACFKQQPIEEIAVALGRRDYRQFAYLLATAGCFDFGGLEYSLIERRGRVAKVRVWSKGWSEERRARATVLEREQESMILWVYPAPTD